MQLLDQRDNKGNKRGKINTYPKSDALDVEKWVISPCNALRRREKKKSLTQRFLQRKLKKRMMMKIVP